jgi:hypothetical protein
MDADQYKTELHRWRAVSRQNLANLARWAEQTALPWLWAELAGILSKGSLKPLRPVHAIRHGLQTTPADREAMPLKPTFYHAHLTMLDSEAKKYIDAATRFNAAPDPYAPNATIYNLHVGLEAIMDYGIILLEQAGHCILNLPGAYGGWARRQEYPLEIFYGAKQIIYGRFSGLAPDDAAPFTPVAVLRTAIENRLRSAYGVYGYYDHTNKSIRHINLRGLFDAIRPHLSQIEFVVDFHDIVRIYHWSNPYLHAGWRDFPWVPGYALEYLHPLFADSRETPNGGWSVNGGIRMPREVWRQIRRSFEPPPSPNRFNVLWQAICGLFQDRRASPLQLNPADEQSATCVFLN